MRGHIVIDQDTRTFLEKRSCFWPGTRVNINNFNIEERSPRFIELQNYNTAPIFITALASAMG